MATQLFGTVELAQGEARAMLCIDEDRPQEFMVHLWDLPNLEPIAILLEISTECDENLVLKARNFFRVFKNGALYLPTLNHQEIADFEALQVNLQRANGGFTGVWLGRDGSTGGIVFKRPGERQRIEAEVCQNWAEFKEWASSARKNHDAALFRGHGSSEFHLQTTLARAGRHRLHRYCADTLAEFHAQAEAVLGLRLNLSDPHDYAVVLGLAQHHGLPSPLLDWTESPYIAAFFAFSDALDQKPHRSKDTYVRIYSLTREFVEQTSPNNVVIQVVPPFVSTLAISPRHNPRLLVQQGRFLVTNISDLDGWFRWIHTLEKNPVLRAVDVPIASAIDALEDLAFMGLTAASLFPGLDGVCKKMRHQMSFVRNGIKPNDLPSQAIPPQSDKAQG